MGDKGQLRLKNASVLLIGAGGLGSPVALYLAAAGLGRLGIVDPDVVDESNLQRQLLHADSTVGLAKTESAALRVRETNPYIKLDLYPTRLTSENSLKLAKDYDVIIDASDNFPTRYLANDTAFFLKKPLVYGAIHRFEGQFTVFAPHLGGPCYRCMLPEIPRAGAIPSCAEAGVLGALPGIIGSLQAMEAIKLILGIGKPPLGEWIIYEALTSSFRKIKLARDPACRLCGYEPSIRSVINSETTSSPRCNQHPSLMNTISAAELKARLDNQCLNALLIDVREVEEWEIDHIPEATLIPLQSIPSRAADLPKDQEIIIHCKAGMRSARACEYLLSLGFENVTNVSGGMDEFRGL